MQLKSVINYNANIGTAVLSNRSPGLPGRVGIPIYIHQERWRHEVWRLLRLFVQHKAVGVADQRSVVCVEENLVRDLLTSGWGGSSPTSFSDQLRLLYTDEFTEGCSNHEPIT